MDKEDQASPASLDTEPSLRLPNGLILSLPSRRAKAAARFSIWEIFSRSCYRRDGFELRPADTVVDVGANVGIFALWAAPQVPRGRVIAIEPTSTIASLQRSAERNGLCNVVAVKAAVGTGKELEIVFRPGFSVHSHRADLAHRPAVPRLLARIADGWRKPDLKTERVQCLSLTQILADFTQGPIDFLKIDCEGGEYDFVLGALASDLRQVARLAMEFHEFEPSQRHELLVSALKLNGFDVEVVGNVLRYRLTHTGMIWASRGV